MEQFSQERSEHAAVVLRQMSELALSLDLDYLKAAVTEMRENHSFKDAAAALNPEPLTFMESQAVNAAKLDQLENFIKVAETARNIEVLKVNLQEARSAANELKAFFNH